MVRKVGRRPYIREPKPGFVYFYRGGRYLHRFTAPEGSEEFDRQYHQILKGATSPARQTWGATIDLMIASDDWREKSPRYRADLEPVLEYIREKVGKRAVTDLKPSDIYNAMERNRHRVRFANYIPVAFSKLAEVARRKGWLVVNPALGIKKIQTPAHKAKAHIPWTDAAVAKWRAESGPLERLIFEIAIGSVQRPADWLKFTWGDYDGESLRITQGKTGVKLTLPCTDKLRAALDAAKAALPFAPMPNLAIIRKRDGQRMTYRRMAEIMLAERKRLGLEAYDLHALRYRGVMELAWAGCDDAEIMSFSGHATKQMVQKYAGEARQIMRAKTAVRKRN